MGVSGRKRVLVRSTINLRIKLIMNKLRVVLFDVRVFGGSRGSYVGGLHAFPLISSKHATPQSVQRPKGRRAEFMTVAFTIAASVDNKLPEQPLRDLDVDVVVFTEIWLRPREGDNNLMA